MVKVVMEVIIINSKTNVELNNYLQLNVRLPMYLGRSRLCVGPYIVGRVRVGHIHRSSVDKYV